MAVYKIGAVAFCASLCLAACGGGGSPGMGGGSPSQTAPPVVTKSYSFPAGDATASAGNTAWDITGITTTLSGQFAGGAGNSYDTLRVDVTFAQNVVLPSPGQMLNAGTQLGIEIGLDTDANSSTGFYSPCNSTLGVRPFEYNTDPGTDPTRLSDGNYSILQNDAPITSGGSNPTAEAMVSFGGNTLSETFFLTSIGVSSKSVAPKIGISVSAFNGSDSVDTDCVPSGQTSEIFST